VERSSGYTKRTFLGCLVILGLVVLCSGVTTLTLDRLCYNTLSQTLPLYPNAQVQVDRHNMFTSRGMGETYLQLYSPDPPDVVSRWYGETVGPYLWAAIRSNDLSYRLGRVERHVSRAEDGVGSMIQLHGVCAN
jgi:hypothetical protein